MSEREQNEGTSGGSSWWKWLLGCGCVGLLMLSCAGFAGIIYSSWVVGSVVESAREGIEVRAEVAEKRKEMVRGENVRVRLEEPLSGDDYRAFVDTMSAWRSTEPFREIESLAEEENSQGNPSVFEQLSAMYKLWKSAAALQKLGGEYLEVVENHGGIETHYGRLLRIGAVIAAAHEVATDHRFDNPGEPVSDAVAKLLYDEHDEVLEAYGDEIERLRSKRFTFQELAQKGDLGSYALATLPAESYEPWAGFSVERREKLIEHFAWSVAAESLTFGGFAFPVTLGKKLPLGG